MTETYPNLIEEFFNTSEIRRFRSREKIIQRMTLEELVEVRMRLTNQDIFFEWDEDLDERIELLRSS